MGKVPDALDHARPDDSRQIRIDAEAALSEIGELDATHLSTEDLDFIDPPQD